MSFGGRRCAPVARFVPHGGSLGSHSCSSSPDSMMASLLLPVNGLASASGKGVSWRAEGLL